MNNNFRNIGYLFVLLILTSCYSFTGGSLPEHIKTVLIKPVTDVSGFGIPQYREQVATKVIEKIRSDNSLKIVDASADSKLTVSIKSIREELSGLTGNRTQLEKERKVTVTVSMDFYDITNKRSLVTKDITFSQVYEISSSQAGRDQAVTICIDNICDQILTEMFSG